GSLQASIRSSPVSQEIIQPSYNLDSNLEFFKVLGAAPKTLIEFTKIIGDLLMNWNPLFYLTLTLL
ncbi:hypothetical protein, partial [Absicoccus intestinalis]